MVAPATAAVVTVEMQRGVIGDRTADNPLKEVGGRSKDHSGGGAAAARRPRAAIRVVHADHYACAPTAPDSPSTTHDGDFGEEPRPGAGRLRVRRADARARPGAGDIVCNRIHGLTPFTGTELDPILRNLGTRTIIPVGVSVNEALLGTCLTAADLGYQIALPADAIAGVPAEYADAVVGTRWH